MFVTYSVINSVTVFVCNCNLCDPTGQNIKTKGLRYSVIHSSDPYIIVQIDAFGLLALERIRKKGHGKLIKKPLSRTPHCRFGFRNAPRNLFVQMRCISEATSQTAIANVIKK